MQVFRPVLLRQARRAAPTARTPWLRAVRLQHAGPHKEYFQQRPGQSPIPDYNPYYQQTASPQQQFHHSSPSRTWRFVRSAFWFALFLNLGLGVGAGLITWEYLQPAFEKGSPEDDELLEEIAILMENNARVESLLQEGWIQKDYYASEHAKAGKHLLIDTLSGTRGLTINHFEHPSHPLTLLIVFTGFGIEGWPDVVHGGVITSIIQEAAYKHLESFYRYLGPFNSSETIDINFRSPLRPGEVYMVFVAAAEVAPDQSGTPLLVVPALVLNTTATPHIHQEVDQVTKNNNVTIIIDDAGGAEPTTYADARIGFKISKTVQELEHLRESANQGPSNSATSTNNNVGN